MFILLGSVVFGTAATYAAVWGGATLTSRVGRWDPRERPSASAREETTRALLRVHHRQPFRAPPSGALSLCGEVGALSLAIRPAAGSTRSARS